MKTLLGVLVSLFAIASPALGDDVERFTFGGDQYVGGKDANLSNGIENDAFAGGMDVVISAPVAGDAHAGGFFSVTISGPVKGNVYAAGKNVTVSGAVGKDATVFGDTITLSGTAPIEGNLRSAGGTISLDRPVAGSAVLAGGKLTLNAPVTGDVRLTSAFIDFGENARVDGRLEINSSQSIDVPASVAPPERVTYIEAEPDAAAEESRGMFNRAIGIHSGWFGAVFGAIAIILYGALLLALFPRRAEIGFLTAMAKPWKSLLFGALTLSTAIGLIVVLAMTLVGIPLAPVAVLLLVLAGLTGYVAGAYFVADRVLGMFNYETDTLWKRIGALSIGLIAAWILGIVPFLGWLVQLGFVFIGLGALSFSAIGRRIDTGFHHELAEVADRAI